MPAPAGGTGKGAAVGWTVAFVVLSWTLAGAFGFLLALPMAGSLAAVSGWIGSNSPASILLQGTAFLLAGLLCTWLIGRKATRLTWADLRWVGAGPRSWGAGFGFLAGGVAAAAALLLAVILTATGWSRDVGGAAAYASSVGRTSLVLAPAALAEEIAFRGVPLVLLARSFGRANALLITAVLFGLGHLASPHVSALALGNIALAGLFLGLAFYLPGGIWTAFGAHLGWNLTLAALDAPVSGLPFPIPLLDFHARGPAWLTGGAFGPEGGVAATLALAVGSLYLTRRLRKDAA